MIVLPGSTGVKAGWDGERGGIDWVQKGRASRCLIRGDSGEVLAEDQGVDVVRAFVGLH